MHEDRDILKLLESGEPYAVELLIKKYQDSIYSLCLRITGGREDAQDCAQETFIKVINNIKSYQPDASLYTWMRKIAVNTCIDHMRKPFKLFSFFSFDENIDTIAAEKSDPERLCLENEADRILAEAVCKLPVKLKTVIVLRETEDMSYDEIADTCGISVGTVKSRIARARYALREILKDFAEQKH